MPKPKPKKSVKRRAKKTHRYNRKPTLREKNAAILHIYKMVAIFTVSVAIMMCGVLIREIPDFNKEIRRREIEEFKTIVYNESKQDIF